MSLITNKVSYHSVSLPLACSIALTLFLNCPLCISAADCFELGRQSYNSGDHYHTTLWMTEALSRQEAENNKTVEQTDILEYLAFSTYMQGNIRQALKLTDELLHEKPNHQRALGNKVYYEQALNTQETAKRGEDDDALQEEAVVKVSQVYCLMLQSFCLVSWVVIIFYVFNFIYISQTV